MATSNQQAAECPECAGQIAQTETDHHCRECGLVVDDSPIDHGPDWRSFESDESDPERAAPGNRTLAGEGMGTKIGRDGDMSNRKRALHSHAKVGSKQARNKNYLTGEARRIVDALDLPDGCGEQAAQLMVTLYDETDSLEGKDLDTVAATGAYVVARVRQQGVSASEVVDVSRDVCRKRLLRRRAWLCETLGLSAPLPDYAQRLRVVAERLDLPDDTIRQAERMLDTLDDMDRQRGKPSSVVACILWRVSDETQIQIGEAAGVTAHTIRNCDKKLPEPEQSALTDY
jgi:transcription initiation factor TFIIB